MPHPPVPTATARRAAPLVILSLLLAGVAFAGSPGAASPARTAGLTFLVADDFQLSGFDGTLLSWRTRGEDGRGWRFGLRLSGSLLRYDYRSDTPDTFRTSSDDRRLASAAVIALRIHEHPRGRALGYYWAVGPTVGYAFSRGVEQNSDGYRHYSRANTWSAGLAGVVGVEWRANDGLSLLAEYGGALEYTWSHLNTNGSYYYNYQRNKDSSIELATREARLGLTAWFR